MIRFRRGVTFKALFYWWGGVNRSIFKPTLMYTFFLGALYLYQTSHPEAYFQVNADSIHCLGTFTVFLLVFRLNQCMARHNEGKRGAAQIFSSLESLATNLILNIKGGKDEKDLEEKIRHNDLALVTKLNLVRLILAWANAWVMHCCLLEATAEREGTIEQSTLESLVFTYCRLQSLLYSEEIELIDRALCVYVGDDEFHTDNNRYTFRTTATADDDRLLFGPVDNPCQFDGEMGARASDDVCGGQTVVHLPKIVMMMIMECAGQPSDKPWGYPQRFMNYILATTSYIMHWKNRLDNLITMPLPLAYLQHCRVLLSLFVFLHPFGVDPKEGFSNNVFMPALVFWAIMGFEMLAEMLENPLGDDETDLNTMAMIHSLEVCCAHAFEMSEAYSTGMRRALRKPFKDFDLSSHWRTEPEVPEQTLRRRHFDEFFRWLPVPTMLLRSVMESHGCVDEVHTNHIRSALRCFSAGTWMRYVLRQALHRDHRHCSRKRVGASRGSYQSVPNNDLDAGDIPDIPKEVVTVVETDPNHFCHYLAFLGSLHEHSPEEVQRRDKWRDRARNVLSGTSAASLLGVVEKYDTERSVLCSPKSLSKIRPPSTFFLRTDDSPEVNGTTADLEVQHAGLTQGADAPLLQVDASSCRKLSDVFSMSPQPPETVLNSFSSTASPVMVAMSQPQSFNSCSSGGFSIANVQEGAARMDSEMSQLYVELPAQQVEARTETEVPALQAEDASRHAPGPCQPLPPPAEGRQGLHELSYKQSLSLPLPSRAERRPGIAGNLPGGTSIEDAQDGDADYIKALGHMIGLEQAALFWSQADEHKKAIMKGQLADLNSIVKEIERGNAEAGKAS